MTTVIKKGSCSLHDCPLTLADTLLAGKKYCYGSMEGEYCHCDYCKCKNGYGLQGKGYGGGCGGHRK